MTKPRHDQGPDYERGFIDGMQHQMQSSVDKAVNAMAQPEHTTKDEALQLALEALEWNLPVIEDHGVPNQLKMQHKAITSIH